MLITFDRLKALPLVYKDDVDMRELQDVLILEDDYTINYLSYNAHGYQSKASSHDDRIDSRDQTTEEDVDRYQAKANTNLNNVIIGEGLPEQTGAFEQYDFIQGKDIQIGASSIQYDGRIRNENDSASRNQISMEQLIGKKVADAQDRTLGKIQNVVIDTEERSLAGVQISEGALDRLLDHEPKYIPPQYLSHWHADTLKVSGEQDIFRLMN
ncbi:PRC-barrel domain-containing protein [Tuberibacillus sp. Marseille-P3662]|uniref:PRC-barrel domain-containing protein n=1 Tax=Tuberibacillus sp. Marseille-P3662 TaxID=1965358 RepID=UPI000A1C80D6|nr:PRC-barrel domain-containing protein [Tuberibacillus sp. Marseille-P3662]